MADKLLKSKEADVDMGRDEEETGCSENADGRSFSMAGGECESSEWYITDPDGEAVW